MDLPQKLDEVLTLMAEGNARLSLQVAKSSERTSKKISLAITVALLLAVTLIVLLSHQLRPYLTDLRGQGIEAVVIILLGLALLRAASHSRY